MTQSTLRTVARETVSNYRQVAEHAIGAYRASGHRLLAMMSRNLDRGTRRIAPQLAEVVSQTSSKVTAVAAKSKAWARESGGRGVVCKRLSLKEISQSVA